MTVTVLEIGLTIPAASILLWSTIFSYWNLNGIPVLRYKPLVELSGWAKIDVCSCIDILFVRLWKT
jgi:hypothetical protein